MTSVPGSYPLSTPASPAATLFSLVFIASVTPFNLVQRLHGSCDDSLLGPPLGAHSHSAILVMLRPQKFNEGSYSSLPLPDYQGKGNHPCLVQRNCMRLRGFIWTQSDSGLFPFFISTRKNEAKVPSTLVFYKLSAVFLSLKTSPSRLCSA